MTDQKYRYFCSIDTCLVFLGGGWTVQPFSAILYHLFMEGGGGWQTTLSSYIFLDKQIRQTAHAIYPKLYVCGKEGWGRGLFEKKLRYSSHFQVLDPHVLFYFIMPNLLSFCSIVFCCTTLDFWARPLLPLRYSYTHTPANHTLESNHKIAITLCTSLQQGKYGSEIPSSQVKGSDPERIRSP